jgi:hypothetical protein
MKINIPYKIKNLYAAHFIFIIFILLFITPSLFLLAARDFIVGTDTLSYMEIFNAITKYDYYSRFGFAYVLINKVSFFIHESYRFFLFFVGGIITASCCAVFLRGVKENPLTSKFWYSILIFFGVLFLSDWYLVGTTNSFRQGLSLPFLYLSLSYLSDRKVRYSIFYFLISISLHHSSLLILPVFILTFFNHRSVFFIFFTLAFSYVLGLNEFIVKVISDFSGLGVYEKIKYYSGSYGLWIGLQIDLFLYTIFWPIMICFGLFFKIFDDFGFDAVRRANRTYMILALPYFIFGFGDFSNRYAYICWLFIPILQAIALSNLKISVFYRSLLSVVLFLVGVMVFSMNVM